VKAFSKTLFRQKAFKTPWMFYPDLSLFCLSHLSGFLKIYQVIFELLLSASKEIS